jgi:hypothetical protein
MNMNCLAQPSNTKCIQERQPQHENELFIQQSSIFYNDASVDMAKMFVKFVFITKRLLIFCAMFGKQSDGSINA